MYSNQALKGNTRRAPIACDVSASPTVGDSVTTP
jgi:hypothetical protein